MENNNKAVETTAKTRTNKNAELEKQVAELKNQLAEKDNMINSFEDRFKMLEQQMLSMPKTTAPQYGLSQELVTVGCNMLTGATLCTKDEGLLFSFDYNQLLDIELSELNECFKNTVNNYRNLFRDGVFYFEDESMYSRMRINEVLDMSDKYIIAQLMKKKIPHQDKIGTDRVHRNQHVFYVVLYKVADLLSKGKLQGWDFAHVKEFEKFFRVDINKVASDLAMFKK